MERLIRLITLVISLGLIAVFSFGCQPAPLSGGLVDDLGREISLDKVPQRIVSHVPGITEILFALGLDEKIVGVSTYCDYPEAAKSKEKVGGFFDPSVEKIVSLEPDIVFTMGDVDYLMTQLDGLGITYVVLQPRDINGILKNIELVGKLTGTEKRAGELGKSLQTRITEVTEQVKDAPRPRVFYVFASEDLNNPWAAGPGSFVDSLITMGGGENIGGKALSEWAQMSIEEVVSSDPEIIMLDAQMGTALTPKEGLEGHPAWQRITAVKQGKIFPVEGNLVNRTGPRIVDGLEVIAHIIHPALFK